MRYLSLALALLSGCAFDLEALRGTGPGASDSGVLPADAALGDAAVVVVEDAGPVVGDDAAISPDAGSDAGPPWVDLCTSSADCCDLAYCTPRGNCFPASAGCGRDGAACCPGFGCLGGFRCVGTSTRSWENTCEVDPDSPPVNPTGCPAHPTSS